MTTSILVTVYYGALALLAIFGFHRLFLVRAWLKTRGRTPDEPPDPDEWPMCTVQLPVYNEVYVVERVLRASAALDYPIDRLQIQLLDDSDDETTAVASEVIDDLRRRGHRVDLVRRDGRSGFKAGALAHGLAAAQGDLVLVLDADFEPPPSLLKALVRHLVADPALGMVQARWGHLNRNYSLLTRLQAILLDGHFVVEHTARNRSGLFFNFNGTAGLWRRQAIDDAGGWQGDTLTEDLDLSYRSQLAGWRFLYLPEVEVPAELPVEVAAFKSQQKRWAKGSIQTAKKLLPTVLRSGQGRAVRAEAFFHLTNNLAYVLGIVLAIVIVPVFFLRADDGWRLLPLDLTLFFGGWVSLIVYYLSGQTAAKEPLWKRALHLPPLLSLGIGLAVSNSGAVLEALIGHRSDFIRTPKTHSVGRRVLKRETAVTPYRIGLGPVVALEMLFSIYFAVAVVLAVLHGVWFALPFFTVFLFGFGYMFVLGVGQRLRPIGRPPLPS